MHRDSEVSWKEVCADIYMQFSYINVFDITLFACIN